MTVVKRANRGQGVARALMLLALAYLGSQGWSSVVTRNDPRNEAVLRLNTRLGFSVDKLGS